MNNMVTISHNIAKTGLPGATDSRCGAEIGLLHHAENVVKLCQTDQEKAVAWLHDVFVVNPDFEIHLFLKSLGFPSEVIVAVELFSKNLENLDKFVHGILTNALATRVFVFCTQAVMSELKLVGDRGDPDYNVYLAFYTRMLADITNGRHVRTYLWE